MFNISLFSLSVGFILNTTAIVSSLCMIVFACACLNFQTIYCKEGTLDNLMVKFIFFVAYILNSSMLTEEYSVKANLLFGLSFSN